MSVRAPGVRDRSFKTCSADTTQPAYAPRWMRRACALEALEADLARLREQQAEALREMDRMGELERSLLRSCVAAEEDARVRCGAARRYATRVIAAAEEQAAASLEAPTRERDRIAREIEAMVERRREAATALEGLIAGLQRVPRGGVRADADDCDDVESRAADGGVRPCSACRGRASGDAGEGTGRARVRRSSRRFRGSNRSARWLVMSSPLRRRERAVQRRGGLPAQGIRRLPPHGAGPEGGGFECPSWRAPPAALLLVLHGSRSRASRQHHAAGARCRVVRAREFRDCGSRSPGPGGHVEHRFERNPATTARRSRPAPQR